MTHFRGPFDSHGHILVKKVQHGSIILCLCLARMMQKLFKGDRLFDSLGFLQIHSAPFPICLHLVSIFIHFSALPLLLLPLHLFLDAKYLKCANAIIGINFKSSPYDKILHLKYALSMYGCYFCMSHLCLDKSSPPLSHSQ